jgi:hypothetical protein
MRIHRVKDHVLQASTCTKQLHMGANHTAQSIDKLALPSWHVGPTVSTACLVEPIALQNTAHQHTSLNDLMVLIDLHSVASTRY